MRDSSGLRGGGCDLAFDQADPVAGAERGNPLGRQPLVSRREAVGDQCGRLLAPDVRQHRHLAARAASPRRVFPRAGEHTHRVLGERIRGNLRCCVGKCPRRFPGRHEHRRNRQLPGGCIDGGSDRARCIVGLGHERRYEDGDHSVNARVVQHGRQRPAIVLVGGRGDHVDGVAQARPGREEGGEPVTCGPSELRDPQARRLQRVGAQDPGAAGVGDHRHRRTSRQWLIGHEAGDVEQLAERLGPNHPGLAEQRVDGDVGGRQQRPGVRAGRPATRSAAPALDGEDRLARADTARHTRELPRVAERLDVEDGHPRLPVPLPPHQHVVA